MSKEQVPSKQRLVLQPKPIDIHHAGQMGLISSNAIPAVSSSLIHGEHVKKRTKGNTLNRRKHISMNVILIPYADFYNHTSHKKKRHTIRLHCITFSHTTLCIHHTYI